MAETELASAVLVPEIEDDEISPSNLLKRSHAAEDEETQEEQGSKRQRRTSGKNISPHETRDGENNEAEAANSTPAPTNAAQEQPTHTSPRDTLRRKPAVVEERQRSKRLFGALLGNLNRPAADARASKKRAEIETRRKAELQRQDDERVEDGLRRRETLAAVRRREQGAVDEENMRIRHEGLLHAANFLRTVAEPRLYYRPWDLRSDEEDRIEQQRKDAQAQVDREVEEFESSRQRASISVQDGDTEQRESPVHTNGNGEMDGTARESVEANDTAPAEARGSDTNIVAPDPDAGREHPSHDTAGKGIDDRQDELGDEEGDAVADGEEDAVIY